MEEPGIIIKLDELVVNRIAAGEVIQRPANALKELIENSLDAKSTSIQIVVKAGGLKYLQIQDNGTGIRRSDLSIVCERFTTSKLRAYSELSSLQTYGFRGEALASISHVAHLSIQTKSAVDKCATRASYEDGVLKGSLRPCAGNQGTQITVEDLFYNVPARKNALRSPAEEYQKVLEVVGNYAVHNASTGFLLKKHGGTADLRTPVQSTHKDNITIVYGNSISRELMEVELEDPHLKLQLHGYITNVNYSNKKGVLVFFINHRLVESQGIKRALDSVYTTYLPKGGKPFVYLSLLLDPQNVDVNVHPTKHEVQFLHEEQIIDKLKLVVEAKLLSCNTSRVLYTQTRLPGATIPETLDVADKSNAEDKPVQDKYLVRTDTAEQKIDKFFGLPTSKSKATAQDEQMEVEDVPEVSRVGDGGDKSPKKNYVQGAVLVSTPAHLPYVDPRQSFSTRSFPSARCETRLSSVRVLRRQVEEQCHVGLRRALAQMVMVGGSSRCTLLQANTQLYLCQDTILMEELFYQILLYDFQNFGFLKFSAPLSLRELALLGLQQPEAGWEPDDGDKCELATQVSQLLVSKASMLLEYYSMEIDAQGNLLSLPLLLENFTPWMGGLPLYVLRLATEVDWSSEQACFSSFSRQTAIFYVGQQQQQHEDPQWQWTLEHVVYDAIKKYFLPPKKFSENGAVLKVASLPDLYKVFERC